MEGLAQAAGHADRAIPLKNYCTGLLLPGERKSVEPMAARLAPDNVRRMHQSLHHVVADAPWSDKAVLGQVRDSVLPAMRKHGPIVCWIVDDTGWRPERLTCLFRPVPPKSRLDAAFHVQRPRQTTSSLLLETNLPIQSP